MAVNTVNHHFSGTQLADAVFLSLKESRTGYNTEQHIAWQRHNLLPMH